LRSIVRVGLAAALSIAASAGTPAVVQAQEVRLEAEPAPLSAYGALPSLELIALSPSGRRMAFITVVGENRLIAVVDLTINARLGNAGVGDAKIRDLQWVGEDRVMITSSSTESLPGLGIDNEELYVGQVYDPAGGQIVNMLAPNRDLFPVLLGPAQVIEGDTASVLVRAHSFDQPGGLDLYRVDPRSGRARVAERMSREIDDYVLDSTGRSQARGRYDQRSRVWSLHLRQGDGFRETWRTEAPIDIPRLMGLGTDGDSVIVAAARPDMSREGREDARFFDVNLETGTWRPVRFEFQPSGLLFHPSTHRMIGATRTEEGGPRYVFFEEGAGTLWAAVEHAFPDQTPSLVAWSDDLSAAVVFTSGATDSGSYHVVNLKDGAVRSVGAAYRAITPDKVAPITPLSYAAADGLEINGYLTTPPGHEVKALPLVVLAHGGPASRDAMGFDWWAQAIASRGYAVLQANFRGSTGYGQEFMEAGYGEWGRKMQTDLSDGVRHLAEQGIIDPERVCIVGASYGGYAAMAGPTLDRGVYRCAVSVAGVSDLRRMVDHEAAEGARRDNDAVRYWNRFMGAERLGDRSLDERSPARLADQADAPILLLHGRDDTVVPIDQSRVMAAALRRAGKPHEFIELNGEDHWLSRTETRQRMLTETLRFLQTHNPPD
jgi:dipeptidyl aminopeptidase/acylaminoacyl peptidase